MTQDQTSTAEQAVASPAPSAETPIRHCDGRTFKRLMRFGLTWLERHQPLVNALNVYPVPDGDTGTNMVLTMQSAYREIETTPEEEVGALAQKVAHGALMGARGNSGVILSQIFRGFARSVSGLHAFDTVQFAAALKEASATAYKGVIKPVEGTILTVMREASEAAVGAAASSEDLRFVLEHVVREARQSVARTPTLLAVLAEAGVVDAGGQGLQIILEGMLRYTKGEPVELGTEAAASVDLRAPRPAEEEGYGYDVQFIIHGEALDVERIRTGIAALGESALVVGDTRAVKVHVHVQEPGTAISYGSSLGTLSRVIVENMQEQYQEFIVSKAQQPAQPAQPLCGICTVAVASGPGLAHVFTSLGASQVVPGGQTMNPSTEELLRAMEQVPCDKIIVLPNNKNIVPTAEQARSLCQKEVMVVPTITVPQGIAALLALNFQADLATNARVMGEAADLIRTAEVTRAVRAAQVNGLQIQEGDVIGLVDGKLELKGDSPREVALAALDAMHADEREIITLYFGEAVTPDEAQSLADEVIRICPNQEVEVVDGGQPHYFYILSAE